MKFQDCIFQCIVPFHLQWADAEEYLYVTKGADYLNLRKQRVDCLSSLTPRGRLAETWWAIALIQIDPSKPRMAHYRRPSANAGPMLGNRRRRWPNIGPTLAERLLFIGWRGNRNYTFVSHLCTMRTLSDTYTRARGANTWVSPAGPVHNPTLRPPFSMIQPKFSRRGRRAALDWE